MGIIEGRTFKSGNSVAVRLPNEWGFEAGTPITLEKVGNRLEIRLAVDPVPADDPVEEKRKLTEMLDEMLDKIKAIWADAPEHPDRGKRDPIEFPERPGLY